MLERPTQIGQERGRFDSVAEISAEFVGRAAFFTAAVVLVLLRMPLIFVFDRGAASGRELEEQI